jgi:hypothetical protein
MTPAELTMAILFALVGVGAACALYAGAWILFRIRTGKWKWGE